MVDDKRPFDADDTRPLQGRGEAAGEQQEHTSDEERRQAERRIKRLMGAEEEAASRSEPEGSGEPLPSQGQPPPGEPGPAMPEEPPRAEEDTPTAQDTPARGLPPVAGAGPSGDGSPGGRGEPARTGAPRRSPPPFPHPTDPPRSVQAEPPPAPVDDDLLQEPPAPADFDATRLSRRPAEAGGDDTPLGEDTPVHDDGPPLPRDVPFEDFDATMVGRAAYRDELEDDYHQRTLPHRFSAAGARRQAYEEQEPAPYVSRQAPYDQPPAPSSFSARPAAPPAPPARREAPARKPTARRKQKARRRISFSWGCITQALMLIIAGAIVAVVLAGTGAAIFYSQVTAPAFRGINSAADLQARAIQFQTTRIRDREGNVLYEVNDPNGGFRDYVTLEEVSPWVIVATVATEERSYFVNPGFSIPAIARAVVQNYREGEVVSGASTITQQLTRALLLPEEERTQRTYDRKVKEIFLAAELGRRFDKEEVLELYLNQIYYGNLAYGIEAAAQTYFDKSAADLNLAEASFLAGLPQAPAVYDPVTNREGAVARQQQVLQLMLEAGCIERGDVTLELPCTTAEAIAAAQPELNAVATRDYQAPNIEARYPHWVVYVQQQLEELVGPSIYTSGYDVYTTLDPRLQDAAQQNVEAALAGLVDRNVGNASVVALDVQTGAILAMVGSKDFYDESISGQVNVALTPQQPGSSIKPFTYLAAFRKGFNPATVIWDVPIQYEIPGFGIYEPVNYSGRFNGPVPVRYAIANSLNIPAVQTLDYVGVPGLLQVLNDVGITSLGDPSNPYNFGLSLTLGAGEVYLIEWTGAFATIASGGVYRPTYAIERIEQDNQVVYDYAQQAPPGREALSPQHAYLMQNILSDKQARIPSFGENTPLSPPYPAGAKTGTTDDFRDNWTMGFTTEVAVGVWVGNTDNSPMLNVTGVTGAGPIWRGVMDAAAALPEYAPQEFQRPNGVFPQTVCVDDGTLAADYEFCAQHSQTYVELFAAEPPGASARLYRQLWVDGFSGLLASDYCTEYAVEKTFLALPNYSQISDLRPFIRNWLHSEQGQNWLMARNLIDQVSLDPMPEQACGPDTPRPLIEITEPAEGSTQQNEVVVRGSVDAPNFSHYRVEFGVSHDPGGWGVVQGDTSQRISNDVLGVIDLTEYENGPMTIRVIVYDTAGNSAERRAHFYLEKRPPTPTPTPEPADEPNPGRGNNRSSTPQPGGDD